MEHSEDVQLALDVMLARLEETGGTIETSLWSPLLNATGFDEMQILIDAARAWRRARGLPDTDDFIVGDEAC